jgi:hypothetical protein
MTKKHFIALADAIREHNRLYSQYGDGFTEIYLNTLADFCESQSLRFNRQRWLDYIAGECGPGGQRD